MVGRGGEGRGEEESVCVCGGGTVGWGGGEARGEERSRVAGDIEEKKMETCVDREKGASCRRGADSGGEEENERRGWREERGKTNSLE